MASLLLGGLVGGAAGWAVGGLAGNGNLPARLGIAFVVVLVSVVALSALAFGALAASHACPCGPGG